MNKFLLFPIGLFCSILMGPHFFAQAATVVSPVKTIEALEVDRYLGVWYEISKFPNWFQKNCNGNTKAEYKLKEDGSILVMNTCKDRIGGLISAVGEARQVGPTNSPKLKVRFAPAWLSFLPFVWGDYWIIDLDDQYQVAVVSDSKREYLWILARTPKLTEKRYRELLNRLEMQQFNVEKLELTNQD